jgi:FKBP-type peptidyl-prolyl cis-trans isomerase FklB
MKILFRTIFAVAFSLTMSFPALAAQTDEKPADSSLKTEKEKLSYSIGMYFGNQIKANNTEVDWDSVVSGMKDVVGGNPRKLTDAQAREVLNSYGQAQRAKRQAEQAKILEKNEKEGKEFLEANKKKPGVQTKEISLPNGKTAELQYKVIKEGTGEMPKATDTVQVHYRGRLVSGKEFDSSSKHGAAPAEFPVSGVVKGWTEALQMMKVGSKWEVYLPSELAYGDRAMGADIEPGSTLIFEMELVGVKPPPPPPAPAQPLTSDIIRVPSAEELKKGEQIQVLKPEEVEKLKKQEAEKQQQQEKKP